MPPHEHRGSPPTDALTFPHLIIALSLLLLTACGTVQERPVAQSAWTRTELYMSAVPEAEWKVFLAEIVTPKFPAGLTVLDAGGQWRGRDGGVRPVPTRILVVLHPGTRATNLALDAIRREFKARFHDESVLRSDSRARVSF